PPPARSCAGALSLHDALPILAVAIELVRLMRQHQRSRVVRPSAFRLTEPHAVRQRQRDLNRVMRMGLHAAGGMPDPQAAALPERSEEHTSELQSRANLVCRPP